MPGQDRLVEIIRLLNEYVREVYGPGAYPTELALRINLCKKKWKLPLVPGYAQSEESPRTAGCDAEARHSPDFRSVYWYGLRFSFSEPQARVIALLWENWQAGTPEVGDRRLVAESGSQGDRLADVFRGSDAWNTMVRPGRTRGTHRLVRPDERVDTGEEEPGE